MQIPTDVAGSLDLLFDRLMHVGEAEVKETTWDTRILSFREARGLAVRLPRHSRRASRMRSRDRRDVHPRVPRTVK